MTPSARADGGDLTGDLMVTHRVDGVDMIPECVGQIATRFVRVSICDKIIQTFFVLIIRCIFILIVSFGRFFKLFHEPQ